MDIRLHVSTARALVILPILALGCADSSGPAPFMLPDGLGGPSPTDAGQLSRDSGTVPRTDAGRNDAGTGSADAGTVPDAGTPTEHPKLILNEVMAINTFSLFDENGDAPAWLEIRNLGSEPASTLGFKLYEDESTSSPAILPNITIEPAGLAVVFLSGTTRENPVHANLTLEASTFIALTNPNGLEVSRIELGTSLADVSVGNDEDDIDDVRVLRTPTPGMLNSDAEDTFTLRRISFVPPRGLYDGPQTVSLFAQAGVPIRYTIDGSDPSGASGLVYSAPITVSAHTTIRATASFDDGTEVSRVGDAHSYIFVPDVINSDVMSPTIRDDAEYGPLLSESLKEHSTLVIRTEAVVDPDIRVQAYVELIESGTDSTLSHDNGFSTQCGIKLVGGHSLNAYPKNNMRLYFKSEFGVSKLHEDIFEDFSSQNDIKPADEFDQLHLRSGSHDSVFYIGSDFQPPGNAQYIRNRFIQDLMFKMDNISTHGRFVHLYLNGEYRGHYHLQERATAAHMAQYLPGSKDEFAYTNSGIKDDVAAWSQVKASTGSLGEAAARINIHSLIDYQLLNYYIGNDWDWLTQRNWMAAGPTATREDAKWNFFPWDSDISFLSVNADNTDPTALSRTNNPMDAPDGVFTALRADPDFQMAVADRAYQLFFNDGILTSDSLIVDYLLLSSQVETSLIAESGRWGDVVTPHWTLRDDFFPEQARLVDDYFPNRTAVVVGQLENQGIYPSVPPPDISVDGNNANQREVAVTGSETISIIGVGSLYFTTDGTDPRAAGGAVSSTALFSSSPAATPGTPIHARALVGDVWSPLQRTVLVAP